MAASPDRKKLDHGRVWVMLSDNERVDHLERQSMQNQATRDRALKAMGLMDDTAPRGPMDGPSERPQDTAARDKAMRLLRGDLFDVLRHIFDIRQYKKYDHISMHIVSRQTPCPPRQTYSIYYQHR